MFNMLNFSTNEEEFWSGFLDKYRELKCLWSKTKISDVDKDRYRIERQSAYFDLLNYCRIEYPRADVNFVTQKLQYFGSLFHKSYKKVLKCREEGVTFNPNLWYYRKMLFLVEDKDHQVKINDQVKDHQVKINDQSNLPPVIITRIHKRTAPTELIQSENSVPSVPSVNCEKYDGIVEIKMEEEENTGDYHSSENDLNIPIINAANSNNYIIENVVSEQSDTNLSNSKCVPGDYTSDNLNLINRNNEEKILKMRKNQKSITKQKHRKSTKSSIDYLTKVTLKEVQKLSREDEYDTAGRKLSFDLRGMSQEQKNLTEKIISEVIYNGKCNMLKSSYIFKPSSDSI